MQARKLGTLTVSPEEVAGVMEELIREGKILHWGISEANEEYLTRAHKVCPVTAVENRYSMMALWHEKLFPLLEKLDIGFIAYSPLANGFLLHQAFTRRGRKNRYNVRPYPLIKSVRREIKT